LFISGVVKWLGARRLVQIVELCWACWAVYSWLRWLL